MQADATLIALRDFFAARDGQAMAAALADLDGPAPSAALDELEFAFNRLFVGPGALDAPPYASVYMDPEGRLMGEPARQAAAVYDALGLRSPLSGSLPDDHLALELDALVAFGVLRAGTHRGPELDALWRFFLREHVARWLPAFIARIDTALDVPPAIRHVAVQLSAWLARHTTPAADTPAAATLH